MADLTKTVAIIFEGDDRLSKAAKEITGKLDDFEESVNKIAAPLARFGEGVLKADAALVALALGGLALAIKKSGEFNAGFNEISSIADIASGDVNRFRNDILAYAQGSTKSIADINGAIYEAISAGVDYKDSINILSTAERLSVAGKADLTSTLMLLVSSLNAYGAGSDQAAKYSDIFFETVRVGSTTIPELADRLARVTGLAASAGIPLETLTAAIAAVTAVGLPTAQAIDGIKQAISNIIKPSSEAEKMAKALGIQFDASALKTKGFDGVLKDVQKATGGNVAQMAELFGSVEALNAVLVLAADKSGKFKEALKANEKAAGATETAYKMMAGNFDLVNQRLANAVNVTLIEIGDKLLSRYGEMAGALGDIFKGLKVGIDSGAFDPVFALLDQIGGEFTAWLKGVAAALPEALGRLDFSSLISALRELSAAFGLYFDGLDLTKTEDLASALQTIVEIITGMVRVTTGMVDAFRPFAEQIAEFLIGMARGDEESQKMVGTLAALAMAVEKAGLYLVLAVEALDALGGSAKGVFNVLAGGAQIMWNGMEIIGRTIQELFLAVVDTVLEALNSLSFGMLEKTDRFKAAKAQIAESMADLRARVIQDGHDAAGGLDKLTTGFAQLAGQSEASESKVQRLTASIKAVPTKVETTFAGNTEPAVASVAVVSEKLATIPVHKTVEVLTQANGTTLFTAVNTIDVTLPKEKQVAVKPVTDLSKFDLKALGDLSQYATQILDIKGKISIANLEAETKRIEAAFDSINESIKSTGTVAGDIFKSYVQADMATQASLLPYVQKEYELRENTFELQKRLAEEQVKQAQAKSEAIRRGDSLIKIEAGGLAPELEAFMWKILERIQVRATEEASEFLLGV